MHPPRQEFILMKDDTNYMHWISILPFIFYYSSILLGCKMCGCDLTKKVAKFDPRLSVKYIILYNLLNYIYKLLYVYLITSNDGSVPKCVML